MRTSKNRRSARPLIKFRKKNGKTFTKRFKSRASATRALKGWRASGGKLA